MGIRILVVSIVMTLGISSPALAEQSRCQSSKIIRAVDELFRADGQVAQMEMRVIRPQSTRTLRMRFWFENGGSGGEDRSLARVEAPAAERGVASLRLGNKMWSFVPSTGRVQQVPESMMLSSWMGSDWTNDDLVRESSLLDDYRSVGCKVVNHDGDKAYRIDLRSRKGREVAWNKIIAIVRKGGENDLMPLVQEYYSKRAGELVLARTMSFSAFRVMGGKRMPSRWVLTPAGRPGRRTEMRFLSLRFDVDIPEKIFSLSNLQKAR